MVLTTFPRDPLLDLDRWVGQRQASFRFRRVNGVTGEVLADITPLRSATITHDTSRTIKRQLMITLGAADTAAVDPLVDRIEPFMVFPNGQEYPLGRFMFTDASRERFTSGKLGAMALNDEMFLVDQQIEVGVTGIGRSVSQVIVGVLADLPISSRAEASPYASAESWSIGAYRGRVLESLSISGDYFSPWFDHNGLMRFIRTFDPATRIADFDFDAGNKVIRQPILETDDLLTAPNRFVVVSNTPLDASVPVVGTYDVPPTAPHSIARRGFVIAQVEDLQLTDAAQAAAVAKGLGTRQTIFERVSLTTAPDPRHDSYNVIHWQGEKWLELAWSMALVEGGVMNHLLRRAYRP
jgi:hypothetical protein